MSFETAAELCMAAETRNITPLVRIPQNSPEIILRYLDAGAGGIIVADMDSPDVALQAVRAAKYPPMGERGLSPVRAADFGLKEVLGEYVKIANNETMVLGIVESSESVESIEDILSTEGLDGVSIGTTDLSKSLGVPGQRNHPKVLEAVEKILAAGRKIGKPIGSTVRQGESSRQYIERGFRMVYATLTSLLADAAARFIEHR
jgi:2-keto-3-deoxy-L-rhamnonate aldolase RhmA